MIDRRKFLLAPLAFARAADRGPNLVLITAGTWRGQAVPWENDPDLVAPNLAKFGKQSAVFSRTYCCSPKENLAQVGLLTSKFPHAARADDEMLGGLKKLTPDEALKAFEKGPFALHIVMQEPLSAHEADAASLHLRDNVPPAYAASARRELAKFYGRCAAIDDALGRVLAALDKANVAENTVVAFTSLRGQLLGSHDGDDDNAFEESVRIPLAIRYPAKLKPDARDLASQVDILPTLLALCGMEIPEGVQGADLFGKSPPEVAFSEGKFGEADEWRMMVRGYDKIVATPKAQITELYNLADDPYELTNLAKDPGQKLKLASLKAQLQAQMKKLGDGMDPSGLRKR